MFCESCEGHVKTHELLERVFAAEHLKSSQMHLIILTGVYCLAQSTLCCSTDTCTLLYIWWILFVLHKCTYDIVLIINHIFWHLLIWYFYNLLYTNRIIKFCKNSMTCLSSSTHRTERPVARIWHQRGRDPWRGREKTSDQVWSVIFRCRAL